MDIVLLRGVGCDAQVFEPLDLANHRVVEVDYHDVLREATDSVETLARALGAHLQGQSFDVIIAHSLGGIIGATMIKEGTIDAECLIAVETAFVPQEESYRTLFHPKTGQSIQKDMTTMLKRELPYYPDALKASLKDDFNYESTLLDIHCPLHLLYGARTMADKTDRTDNLNLNDKTVKKAQIDFIENAAHFPFLENAPSTNQKIHAILRDYAFKD